MPVLSNKRVLFVGLIIIVVVSVTAGLWRIGFLKTFLHPEKEPTNISEQNSFMKISSPSFADKQTIPSKYTCDAEGINPPIEISGVPASAKALAIILRDPDAPSGNFIHWILTNLDPNTKAIAEGFSPVGATAGLNSCGDAKYCPPCPPTGSHRYIFTLYALDSALSLSGKADESEVLSAMRGHILEQAELVGLYSRKANHE